MEFRTFGKPDNPTLLLIPGDGMDCTALYTPLKKLESRYYLLLPDFSAESPERRVEAVEECLLDHFSGRIWGAYGLDAGGSLLLSLLARGRVRIRTVIVDGTLTLPDSLPDTAAESVICWYGSRDKTAKKLLKTLRERRPDLQTLQLKKLRVGERFIDIRPDQMLKRLKRSFGSAKVLTMPVLLEVNTQDLWTYLNTRDHTAAEQLKAPAEVTEGPGEYTLVIEGQSALSKRWSHLVHLEALDAELTLCTHQLELAGGALSALTIARAKALLKKEHRRWKQCLNPAPPRRFPGQPWFFSMFRK